MRTRRAGPWAWVICAYLLGMLGCGAFGLSERHAAQIGALLAGITFVVYVITFAVRLLRVRRQRVSPSHNADDVGSPRWRSSVTIPETYREALTVLDRFISGEASDWEWDDFTSIRIKDDAWLEAIRLRCGALGSGSPNGPGGPHAYRAEVLDEVKAIREEVEQHLRAVLQGPAAPA